MDAPDTPRPAIEAFCKVVCGFVRFWPDHAAITAELKVIPILFCVDPSVVRVEAQLLYLMPNERDDPQAAIDSRAVSPEFTKAGDGVWVGPSPYVVVPWAYSFNSGHLVAFCQGYDAAGNLVCSYDPTEHRE